MKKSIIFVNRYFYPDLSATSQLLTDLVRALTDRGFIVQVICSRQLSDDVKARLPPRDQIFGARIHRLATSRFGRDRLLGRALDYATFYVSCAWLLLRILKRGDVLVVKTDPPLMVLLAAPIAAARAASLVNWQQDVFPEVATRLGANPLPGWLDAWLRRLRDASLRSSSMTVVIGSRMQDFFLARAVPSSKLCIIENWADGEAIKPKLKRDSALRAKLGLGDQFVVCYSGNLGRAHEYQTLLLAAEALRSEVDYIFLIIGDGAQVPALKAAVDNRKLDNFRFIPHQPRERLEDSLAAADVHLASLLPVLEGLIVPSKLYGILAAGRPVIFVGDPDGDIGRVVDNAQCGITVLVGDPMGLAEALRRLRGDPEMAALMGSRARQLLCAKYTLQHAVDRWLAVLHA